MANYVITRGGAWYLSRKAGWGPTFTSEISEARTFKTVGEAYEYRRRNLWPGCGIGVLTTWGVNLIPSN